MEINAAPTGGTAQLPNPQHQHNTVEALEAAVGFPVPVPAAPAGFSFALIQDIGGTLAELRWSDEVQELTYRVSRGGSDNSGDYTVYPASGTLTVRDASVQWRGDEGGIRVALWTQGGFSFSLRASDGLTERQVRRNRSVLRQSGVSGQRGPGVPDRRERHLIEHNRRHEHDPDGER